MRRGVSSELLKRYLYPQIFLRISRKANASVQCPVQEGTYEIIHTVKLPKEIPPGELLLNGDDKNHAERVS